MPVATPTRYETLHLLIDRDVESRQHYVRILPPAPALDSFRDVMFRLDVRDDLPSHVAELLDHLDETLGARAADLSETSPTFKQIKKCGEWLDGRLRDAAAGDRGLLRDCLRDGLSLHNLKPELGVLIVLHFGEHAHDLGALLWETWNCTFGGGHPFLIMRDWVSLVRFVPGLGTRAGSRDHPGRPLRLLATTCSFRTDGSRDPEIEGHIDDDRASLERSLADLIGAGVFAKPIYLDDPTTAELKTALQDADILHHFGHGAVEGDQAAYLMLKDRPTRAGKKVFWYELQECFEPGNAPALKLVVLNACELQRAGLATEIARIGVPAVVAMQAEIDARVIADRGFTETFYTRLAAGDPVHAAFSKARAALWSLANCVEAFVPVLILSTLDHLEFHHPEDEQARRLAEAHQRRQDPFKPKWDEAAELEERGEIEAAVERFIDLASAKPDYPGLQERLALLSGRVDRQKRVLELVEQLDRAGSAAEPRRLQDLLRDTAPLASEPVLTAALERWLHVLERQFEELRRGERWLEARELLRTLQAISEQLPAERRLQLPAGAAESVAEAARLELAERRASLATMARRQEWVALIAPAQLYLTWEPADETVRNWLSNALEVARTAERIKFDGAEPLASQAYEQIKALFERGDWQQVTRMGEELREQLHPTLRSEIDHLMLTAAAQQHKEQQDWPAVKQLSREVLRVDPGDLAARQLLSEALRHEAEAFIASQRWEEAETECHEILRLAPERRERKRALELLGRALLGQIEEARRGHDWGRVLAVSERILDDPELEPRHKTARKSKEEAEEALRLLRRIQLF